MANSLDKLKKEIDKIASRSAIDFSIYWGKKNPHIAAAIINTFSKDGDLVLDPFLGSGSSLYGFLQSNIQAKFIGTDINEQPIQQTLFNLSIKDIKAVQESKKNFMKLYLNKNPYILQIHKKKFEIIKAKLDLEPKRNYLSFEIKDENDKKIIISKKHEFFTQINDYFCSINNIKKTKNDLMLAENTRIAIKSNMYLSEIYSPITFKLLLEFKKIAAKDPIFRGVLASVLHLCKYTDIGSQSQFPYWYPKQNAIERNVIDLIISKYEEIMKKINGQMEELEFNQKEFDIFKCDARNLSSKIKDKINIVITDPPYYDQVAYSEYLIPWQFFLGAIVDLKNEIVQSNRKDSGKTKDKYLHDMKLAFSEISKIATEDAKLFMYYKDSRLSNISEILEILGDVGWNYVNQIHVNRGNYTYKQNSTKSNTVPGDCLLIFQKGSKTSRKGAKFKSPEQRDQAIINLIMKELKHSEKITLSKLYDEILVPQLFAWGHLKDFKEPGEILNLITHHFRYDLTSRSIGL